MGGFKRTDTTSHADRLDREMEQLKDLSKLIFLALDSMINGYKANAEKFIKAGWSLIDDENKGGK